MSPASTPPAIPRWKPMNASAKPGFPIPSVQATSNGISSGG